MKRRFFSPITFGVAVLVFGLSVMTVSSARGQERQTPTKWQYLAVSFGPNENEVTKRLNQLAAEGWQYVGPLGHNLVAFKRMELPANLGPVADVRGTVTLNDVPLESGTIRFFPVDGKAPTTGGIIKQGKFALKVPIGSMKVSISAPKVVGKKKLNDTPDSPMAEIVKEMIPAKYNDASVLVFEVKAGKNECNLELRSK